MVFIHLLIATSCLTRLGDFHTLHQLPLLLRFLAPFLSQKLSAAALPPYPGRLGPCGCLSHLSLSLSLSLHREVLVEAL